jgi:hypothetical protein
MRLTKVPYYQCQLNEHPVSRIERCMMEMRIERAARVQVLSGSGLGWCVTHALLTTSVPPVLGWH